MSEQEVQQSVSEQASEGIRARRAFMLKFLLGGEGGDWINKNIVAKGKGASQIVGRVFGVCTGTEVKNNVLPDGSLSRSIVLFGQFEYESTVTGEVGQASSAFLPMAYADGLAAAFASDPTIKMIEVDLDIGLEATGKTIPYEWLVINHAGGEASLLQKLRSRRKVGERALAALKAAPALAAPADVAHAETGASVATPEKEPVPEPKVKKRT
jgi:hypothetical protein